MQENIQSVLYGHPFTFHFCPEIVVPVCVLINSMQSIKDPFHFCAFFVKGSGLFIESYKLLVKYMFLNHVERVKKRQSWAC